MKKFAVGLAAVAVLMLGTAQMSRADLIIQYSLNGAPTVTQNCGVVTSCTVTLAGTVNGSIQANANLPGSPIAALNQQANTVFNNSGTTAANIAVTVISTGFTQPLAPPPLSLTVGGTTNISLPNSTFSYTAGGGGNATNGLTITTGPLSCGPITTQSTTCVSPAITFSPTGTFSLISTGDFSLGANSSINATTTVTASAVPEPGSIMLFGSGLVGLAGVIRRKLGK